MLEMLVPRKAPPPSVVTSSPSVISVREAQPRKAFLPIVFKYLGHRTSVIPVWFLNASLAICVTLFPSMPSGISIDPVAPT